MAELLNLQLSDKMYKAKTAGTDASVYKSKINIGLIQKNGCYNIGEDVTCLVFNKGKKDIPNIMGRIPLFLIFRIIFEEYKDCVHLTYVGKTQSRRIQQKSKK